jgi:hypothetical protein
LTCIINAAVYFVKYFSSLNIDVFWGRPGVGGGSNPNETPCQIFWRKFLDKQFCEEHALSINLFSQVLHPKVAKKPSSPPVSVADNPAGQKSRRMAGLRQNISLVHYCTAPKFKMTPFLKFVRIFAR